MRSLLEYSVDLKHLSCWSFLMIYSEKTWLSRTIRPELGGTRVFRERREVSRRWYWGLGEKV
jgi:hypothetical protein